MYKSTNESPENTAVIMLGMHRSGTSCLAGSLQQRGLYLGQVLEWGKHNRKGTRENTDIGILNESILEKSNGSWSDPPANISWDINHVQKRDSIIKNLSETSSPIWGFKDPRTLFTLPFWERGLEQVKFVGTYRHPVLVARSLNTRNKMPINIGLQLWLAYNTKLVYYLEKYKFPIISFDIPQKEYLSVISCIASHLHLDVSNKANDDPFINESLRNSDLDEGECVLPKNILTLYRALNDIYAGQEI